MSVIKVENFNANQLTFTEPKETGKAGIMKIGVKYNGQYPLFQTGKLYLPFGISEFKDDNTGKISYTVGVNLKDRSESTVHEEFKTFLNSLREKLLDTLFENKHWFKKSKKETDKITRESIEQYMFWDVLKAPSDGKEEYGFSTSLKIPVYDDVCSTKFYSSKQIRIKTEPSELSTLVPNGSSMKMIFTIPSIFIIGGKASCGRQISQAIVYPSEKVLDNFAFVENDGLISSDDE